MNTICVTFCLFFLKNVICVDSSKLEEPIEYNSSYFKQIKSTCEKRDDICGSKDRKVCAVKLSQNKTFIYKTFNNSCYVFLTNMCECPSEEFSIVSWGPCAGRRMFLPQKGPLDFRKTTAKPGLRGSTELSTLYNLLTAYDGHVCAASCPDLYEPICVIANRNDGQYRKIFTFANHCLADLYYCDHWEEFDGPPGEDQDLTYSRLSWSFCAANRYIQFARFSEMASAMGHYGWLSGDYSYHHILNDRERKQDNG